MQIVSDASIPPDRALERSLKIGADFISLFVSFFEGLLFSDNLRWTRRFFSIFCGSFKPDTGMIEMYLLFSNACMQYMTMLSRKFPSIFDDKAFSSMSSKAQDINNGFISYMKRNKKALKEQNIKIDPECFDIDEKRPACCKEILDFILKNIPLMSCIIDNKGKFVYVSPWTEVLTGYTTEEFIAKNQFFDTRKKAEKMQSTFKEALLNGSAIINLKLESKKNTDKEISSKVISLHSLKEYNLFLIIFLDPLIRMELALELKRSQEELQQMFDAITDPLFVLDRSMKIARMNKFLKDRLGVREYKDILGKKANVIKYEGEPLCLKADIEEVFTMGKVYFKETYSKDEKKYYLKYIYPIRSGRESDTSVTSALIYKKDMTNHKIMEEEIQHLERLATLGRLSAIVAHEIRNPLSGIALSASLLKKKVEHDWRSIESLENILEGINKIETVILRLLDFSKPKKTFKRKVNILEPLKETLFFIKPRAIKRSIDIIEKYPSSIPHVLVDPDQMTQVFINLLLNAIQAIKGKGEVTIKVFLWKNRHVIVQISDTGAGIRKDDMPRIFEPFFTTKSDGTGLGLTISKNILMQNDVDISVESVEGEGTSFTLDIKAHYEI